MEKQEKIFLIFRRMSKIASIISIFVGVFVLIGWTFNIAVLESIFPQFITMKANAALSFILLGLSLFFLQGEESISLWKTNTAKITSTLAFLIGAITLAEIIFNWDAGIDQLFFKDTVNTIFTSNHGRMMPATAFNFSLLGLAFICLSFNRLNKLVQSLSIITIVPSLLVIIGYVYGIKQLTGVIPLFAFMAVHAAITFFILSLGSLFARPKLKPIILMSGDDLGGVAARRLIPIMIFIISLFGYFQLAWHSYVDTSISLEESNSFALANTIITSFLIFCFLIIIWVVSATLHKLDSSRKDIAEKLKEESDKVYALLHSIGDAVVAIDRSWNIILWNNGAQQLSGWSEEEVIGKPFRDFIKLIRERDRSENVQFIEEVMITGKAHSLKDSTFLIKKDGKEVSVSDSAAPIITGGRVAGVIIIMRDSTIEKESTRIHSSLAYASHQLLTPITKALWTLELVLKEKDGEKIKNQVALSYQTLKSVKRLSEEIVVVSEADQAMVIPDIKEVKLADLIDDVVNGVSQKAKEQKVKIIVPSISVSSSIKTDQQLLARVFTEILDNAIIYGSKKSEIKINIKIEKDSVLIEIQNSGIGIITEHQPLIFTKFFRGGNFSTTDIMGAGLGLYIAKAYIELLHGKIWFRTEENKETTFYVSIPF